MPVSLELGGVMLAVRKKDIKNVHLSVYPPMGRVSISAPMRMSLETIRVFAISKLGWIRRQQKLLQEQERESQREYINRESHYVWGRRYLLKVVEEAAPPSIRIRHDRLILHVRPGADASVRGEVMSGWYRDLLREEVSALIKTWELRLGVRAGRVFIQQMKTKWGSCNPAIRSLRVNTELAKKPKECLEYIVLHEMVHLLERKHGPRFVEQMDRHMPSWREVRNLLNRLPARHESWSY
jgi:predicted metal-dependent hydrolase